MVNTLMKTETCRIYIACLAAYNSGWLHGEWVDVSNSVSDLQDAIKHVLKTSPVPDAEEWAFHDYEGFGDMHLSEYESLETLVNLSTFIEEHGDLGRMVLSHYAGDLDEAEKGIENYAGCFDSLEDFAESYMEETGQLHQVPEHLRYYIDFQAYGKDMEVGGDVFTVRPCWSEVHVFWNN